jgi:hypothetical protein
MKFNTHFYINIFRGGIKGNSLKLIMDVFQKSTTIKKGKRNSTPQDLKEAGVALLL